MNGDDEPSADEYDVEEVVEPLLGRSQFSPGNSATGLRGRVVSTDRREELMTVDSKWFEMQQAIDDGYIMSPMQGERKKELGSTNCEPIPKINLP